MNEMQKHLKEQLANLKHLEQKNDQAHITLVGEESGHEVKAFLDGPLLEAVLAILKADLTAQLEQASAQLPPTTI